MYNATINACREKWQLALSLLLELEGEALEKDSISFNSSIGATNHHWPMAMLLFVEAQDSLTQFHLFPDDMSGDCLLEISPLVQKQHIAVCQLVLWHLQDLKCPQ